MHILQTAFRPHRTSAAMSFAASHTRSRWTTHTNNVQTTQCISQRCLQDHLRPFHFVPPCVAAAEACWGRPLQRQQSSSNSSTTACRSSRQTSSTSPPLSEPPQQQEQRPIRIALNSSSAAVARSILYQLQAFGSAEVWATSAANHFTAIQGLAEAHKQLQERQRQGLAATATLSASDQKVADDQKRGLKKLTLAVQLTAPVDGESWAAGRANHISTNRTSAVPEVMQLVQQQLCEAEGAVVVQARGEQAVTRALKAALSLQAGQEQVMLIQPWQGQVVDIVAEKRGEQRLANGLLLRMSWSG